MSVKPMTELKRKYSEIKAIAALYPELKSIYVEGVSDFYLINDFLAYHKIEDIKVYIIDDIDIDELYTGIDPNVVYNLRHSNKERVIFLAQSLEKDLHRVNLPILCIVDTDWDRVLNCVRTSKYLSYTDYNSMDMYLCSKETVSKYLHQGHRINTRIEDQLLTSLLNICRQVFHVHCLLHERKMELLSNDKAFAFDRPSQSCSLDFDKYWLATLTKNNLTAFSEELKATYDSRFSQSPGDIKNEVRGHDFVHYLYLCVRKMKPKISMAEEEFANMFWKYADIEALKQEGLFEKIMAL